MANIRPLPPNLAKKAKEELNEDPERIVESLEILKNWIKKQPYIRSRLTDQFLIAFLRSSKYSIEQAKQQLIQYYDVRNHVPEIFHDRKVTDPKWIEYLRFGFIMILPNTCGENGPNINLVRPGNFDAKKYSIYDAIKPGIVMTDIGMVDNDNLIINGLIEIVDMAGATMDHFAQYDLMFMKKSTAAAGESSPIKFKGIHFINTPPGLDWVFVLFKSYLSEKRKSPIYIHGNNMDELYKYVPQKYLPVEYGGENGSIPDVINGWEKKFLEYRDYFIEEENFGIIEELKPQREQKTDHVFGVDGTFRKLNVD